MEDKPNTAIEKPNTAKKTPKSSTMSRTRNKFVRTAESQSTATCRRRSCDTNVLDKKDKRKTSLPTNVSTANEPKDEPKSESIMELEPIEDEKVEKKADLPPVTLELDKNNNLQPPQTTESKTMTLPKQVTQIKLLKSLKPLKDAIEGKPGKPKDEDEDNKSDIPEVLRKQGNASFCSASTDNDCPCNTFENVEQPSRQISFCDRKNWISIDRLNELRKRTQDAIKGHKTFTIRGCFFSIRNALVARGWVEKLDVHRKHNFSGVCQVTYEDIAQTLPKRKPGESRRQYLIKCERNIMSRFLEHVPIDFLWTARKEKCDWIDQAKNPSMIINKFHRVPFTTKEGLCTQLRDFHWFYEEGTAELYFPRCYNVWSPEETAEFIDNFRVTACISFLKFITDEYRKNGYHAVFADSAKVPFSSIDFAFKRVNEFIESCRHYDIDNDDNVRIWDHDWDAFLTHHYVMTHENARIQLASGYSPDKMMRSAEELLLIVKTYWPQYNLDGYLNIWIVKPANKCRGRGIILMNNIKKIMAMINPPITSKSRYVVQKYLERPLIIHNTKFDIRQWFLVTSVQPLVIWMYKESYLRFSSQEYNLQNYHESVHLTNHAVQKKYRNGKRDERLPTENMWDCYTFQAYLRQIGEYEMWTERIYPGMQRAIIGTMLASQDNMDRRINTFELFGADFMISEDFYPWLLEINSSPDLGATTSVTARMCPQCLEDIIKVVIDRRADPKADTGNWELIYRQVIPPTPAYMGLNLFLKGRQIMPKNTYLRREKSAATLCYHRLSTPVLQTVVSPAIVSPIYDPCYLQQKENPATLNDRRRSVVVDSFDGFDSIDLSPSSKLSSNSDLTCKLNNNGDYTLKRPQLLIPNYNSHSFSDVSSDISPILNNSRLLSPNTLSSLQGDYVNYIQEKKEERKRSSCESDQKATLTRRHRSCGPRLSASNTVQASDDNGHLSDSKDVDTTKLHSNFECIGSKCSLEKLNVEEPEINSIPSTPNLLSSRRSIGTEPAKCKTAQPQKLERLCNKSRVPLPEPLPKRPHTNCARTSTLEHFTNVKNAKLFIKNSNSEYLSSPFYAVGMSLRAWRSRYNKIWKSSTNLHKLSPSYLQYKNMPLNDPALHQSPKRQLCKDIAKKMTSRSSIGAQ